MQSFIVAMIAFTLSEQCTASPCSDVDRPLDQTQQSAFGHAVAAQLPAKQVDVLQSFRVGGWRILYVDTHVADEAFLFFSQDPTTQHYLTRWSGGAGPDEEAGIRGWALKNAPGIPPGLAACFALHVTKDRDL